MNVLKNYTKTENSTKRGNSFKTLALTALLAVSAPLFSYAAPDTTPSFTNGTPQSLTICENTPATSINNYLTITDGDLGQTETWSVFASPSHGVITIGTTMPSGPGFITPSGFAYTPVTGYSGTDAFLMMVYDGFSTSYTLINVTINAVPTVQTFTGGGAFCSGDAGVHIGLTTTESGINYQLFAGNTPQTSPMAGNGNTMDFGIYNVPGYYSAVATDPGTGCFSPLPGVTVSVNPLPDTFTVVGGGTYCPNGTGADVTLTGSAAGIDYQLYDNNGNPVGGPVAGTGSTLDFGPQVAGTYTAIATNATTHCVNAMAGAATVTALALPAVFNVTGGGTYCVFGHTVNVGLDGSETDATYHTQYLGFVAVGSTVTGTGNPVAMGSYFLPGAYTVIATSTVTGCTNIMNGSATLTINIPPLPRLVSATNNGSYCSNDSGVHVMMSGSTTSVKYQLYRNDTAIGNSVAGTGNAFDFGLFTTPGIYKISAIDTVTGCSGDMLNTVTVSIIPAVIPTVSVSTGIGAGNEVCLGALATFTAMTQNGGTAPTYVWHVNNIAVGTADSTYSYVPVNGDLVIAELTSNEVCASPLIVIDTIHVNVDTLIAPFVTLQVTPLTSVPAGTSVTLTAMVTNGGMTPSYQWYINGALVPGATNATYTSTTFRNNDSVSCEVVSSGGCGGVPTFNSVVMRIFAAGINGIATAGNVTLVPNPNKGEFIINGAFGKTSEEVTIEVTNMLGQVVYTDKVMTANGTVNASLQMSSALSNGMYILNMKTANESAVIRFVIEK